MSHHHLAAAPPSSLGLLVRLRGTLLRNRIRQMLDQSPLRVLLVLAFIGIIWLMLYAVFSQVLPSLTK